MLDRIGRGGMAVVYLARQTDLDRFVALKQLKVLDDDDPSYAQRFLRESRVAGSLTHPNIVTVYDYFEHDGTPYIAMEYVERGSLRPYVGDMTLAQIAGVFEGLLAGLAHGESQGIVHRDLKPENLMVTADGRVKIADFGIAKATTKMQTGAFKTRTGTTIGTPTYMAPEQAMAQEIGPWTDLYSVGCMAFELFTGRVPFHDTSEPMAILLRQINEPLPPVKSIDPGVDQGISDWVERLLVKDPAERTQSAHDAWDELEEIVIGLFGPRWRRQARLVEPARRAITPRPLTPAPFQEAPAAAEEQESEEFESFSWDPAALRRSKPYTPPPHDLPPGPMTPAEAGVPEAPPAPEPEPEPVEPPAPTPPPAPTLPPEPAVPTAQPPAPKIPPRAPMQPEPPAPAAAPAAPGARGARPLAVVAGAIAALALLGVLAFLLAPSEETPGTLSLDDSVSAGDLSFRVPAGWQVADPNEEVEIPGLALSGLTVSRPPAAARGESVLAGLSDSTDRSLLPDSFEPGVEAQAIRLPAGNALRYPVTRPEGSSLPVTIIALATEQGVATLACQGAPGSAVDRACDAIARTLEPGARVYSPPPRQDFAAAINGVMRRLTGIEERAEPQLGRVERPAAVARAVARLGGAYLGAAREIGRIDAAPYERAATRAVEQQLERIARAHIALGKAARDRDRARYRRLRDEAGELRDGLVPRLRTLRGLGYEVQAAGGGA